ncbi:MAG: glycosyltransferase family 4 protein [Bacteroidia bacterium]|nr:glycosyltransferase family 4 protein [Bacteroidia bacterium]MDW8015698.1 glycosyltransferase family 4 protein [Bacteroidia bacterium]
MRRILQLTTKPPYPLKDGGALATAHTLEAIHELGWAAWGLTMNTYKHRFELPPNLPIPITVVEMNTRPTLYGAFMNLFSSLPYHLVRFQSRAYAHTLEELIQAFRPDLVQVESLYLTPYVEKLPVRRVYRMHNIESQIWHRYAQEQSWYLRSYFRLQAQRIERYELQALPTYDGILAISEKEAQWSQAKHPKGRVMVFPFGLEIERYNAPPLEREPPRIGFIGGLDWLPNLEGLVWFLEKVWIPFRRKHPKAILSIAGRNTPSWLSRYADSHTHILGEITEAREFFYSNDIFVVPLFSGSGIRIKLIEAFATGRAVVATPIAAEGLTCKAGHHLLIAETPHQFIEALSLLYTDASLRARLGEAARSLAERVYDRKSFLPHLREFYESLLSL